MIFNVKNIPDYTMQALFAYVLDGVPPGGFLRAVLENDLCESYKRADDRNIEHIGDLIFFIYNHVPSDCWREHHIEEWIGHRGYDGQPALRAHIKERLEKALAEVGR